MTDGLGRAISKEKLKQIELAIEDGWPLKQITKTYSTSWGTIRRHFPDYRGMCVKEAGGLGGFTARQNRKLNKR